MRKIHKGETFVLKKVRLQKRANNLDGYQNGLLLNNKQIEDSFMNLTIPQSGYFWGKNTLFYRHIFFIFNNPVYFSQSQAPFN